MLPSIILFSSGVLRQFPERALPRRMRTLPERAFRCRLFHIHIIITVPYVATKPR